MREEDSTPRGGGIFQVPEGEKESMGVTCLTATCACESLPLNYLYVYRVQFSE